MSRKVLHSKEGGSMQIGIIGAGRVGCSMGKYLVGHGADVLGYYDTNDRAAEEAAQFTGTERYDMLAELVSASKLIFITTPDGIILSVWKQIRHLPLAQKIICHCSGALSSDSFSGIEDTHVACLSIHPMLPFSNRFSSYEQLEKAFFTVEGDSSAIQVVSAMFEGFGNRVCSIRAEDKPRYHAAASILSNQVVAVLNCGYALLEQCGFSREEAIAATATLVRQNVNNVIENGCVDALTGPIERCDLGTVEKHLSCLGEEDAQMYRIRGTKLVASAEKKNPGVDYGKMRALFQSIGCKNEEDEKAGEGGL